MSSPAHCIDTGRPEDRMGRKFRRRCPTDFVQMPSQPFGDYTVQVSKTFRTSCTCSSSCTETTCACKGRGSANRDGSPWCDPACTIEKVKILNATGDVAFKDENDLVRVFDLKRPDKAFAIFPREGPRGLLPPHPDSNVISKTCLYFLSAARHRPEDPLEGDPMTADRDGLGGSEASSPPCGSAPADAGETTDGQGQTAAARRAHHPAEASR